MARRWTAIEEEEKRDQLRRLYVRENKTIGEIAYMLGISEPTVFQRMMRLGIRATPERKLTYAARKRGDIIIPTRHSPKLAEFFGIMLGDGSLSHYQVVITLGTKEFAYAEYVVNVIHEVFGAKPKIGFRRTGFKDVYLGSVDITEWLQKQGLVFNKVVSQVDVPEWIFSKPEFMISFLRGFFDTDGSVYRLRFGIQASFTNKSLPILKSLRRMLYMLGYHPSAMSAYRIYLTRRGDVTRFFKEVVPANQKHVERFEKFANYWVGRPVGGGDWL